MSGIKTHKPAENTVGLTNLTGGAAVGGIACIRVAGGFDVVAGAGLGADFMLLFDVADLKEGTLAMPGQIVTATAGAAFADGARLAANAAGKLITAVTGNHVVATALEAAGALDATALVLFHGGHPVEPV